MESISNLSIFVDESGDTSIKTNVQGVSLIYCLAAVVVSDENIQKEIVRVDKIRSDFFSGGELKSSRIGSNQERRRKILQEIKDLDFKFFILCIDKSEISAGSVLQHKKTFYKYVNRMLYDRLVTPYASLCVNTDGHGYPEFIKSFKKYVDSKYSHSLLRSVSVNVVDSENNNFVQLADILAGSYRRNFEGVDNIDLSEMFKGKIVSLYRWPMRWSASLIDDGVGDGYDGYVRSLAARSAEMYLEDVVDDSEIVRMRMHVLTFLLYNQQGDNDYCYGDTIIDYLVDCGFSRITKHVFQQDVIAPLRDARVIISTCGRGYKLPATTKDMCDYAETVKGKVVPYITRLQESRNTLKDATLGEYDILSGDSLRPLKELLD